MKDYFYKQNEIKNEIINKYINKLINGTILIKFINVNDVIKYYIEYTSEDIQIIEKANLNQDVVTEILIGRATGNFIDTKYFAEGETIYFKPPNTNKKIFYEKLENCLYYKI